MDAKIFYEIKIIRRYLQAVIQRCFLKQVFAKSNEKSWKSLRNPFFCKTENCFWIGTIRSLHLINQLPTLYLKKENSVRGLAAFFEILAFGPDFSLCRINPKEFKNQWVEIAILAEGSFLSSMLIKHFRKIELQNIKYG